jgi:hypothetical protein
MELEMLAAWAAEGSQKSAILRVMRQPLSGSQILSRAQKYNSRITYRDLWAVLQAATKKGVVECLTPDIKNGKIYFPTSIGRRVLQTAFSNSILTPPEIDWNAYAYLCAGKARWWVFLHLEDRNGHPRRATDIKKALREVHGVTLNQTSRALLELELCGLIKIAGVSKKRASRLFGYTSQGRSIRNTIRIYASQLY